MSTFSKAEREVIEEYLRDVRNAKKSKPPQGEILKNNIPNPVREWQKQQGLR